MWKDNPDLRVCASPNPFEGDEWATYWRAHLEGTPEVPATPIVRPVEPRTRTARIQYAYVKKNGVTVYRADVENGDYHAMLMEARKACVPEGAIQTATRDGWLLSEYDPHYYRAEYQHGADAYVVMTDSYEEEVTL